MKHDAGLLELRAVLGGNLSSHVALKALKLSFDKVEEDILVQFEILVDL